MPADSSADRRQLRERTIAARRALDPTQVSAKSATICQHLVTAFVAPPGRRIGFCWPVHNEPDVRAALAAWSDHGAVACLPVVVAKDTPLAFRLWTPETALVEDRYGIPMPASGDFVMPDALLLPLNAFDRAGYRIGYGGGYFDRTLAAMSPRPLAIGVGFELGRVESIAPEAHDQPVDWIVTELGAFRPTCA